MSSQLRVWFVSLIIIALVARLLLDFLGHSGYLFKSYPAIVFEFAGLDSTLSFESSKMLYFAEMILFHLSLFFLLFNSKIGIYLSILVFALQLAFSFLSGIYVGVPYENTLSYIIGFSHNTAFALAIIPFFNLEKSIKSFKNQ